VRDVGGKGLGEAQVLFELAGELLQGAGEVADLVAAAPRKLPLSRPRRSTRAKASSRRRLSGRAMVVETSRLRTAAAATERRKTLKMSSRTSTSAPRMRKVDCDTRTAPTTSPPLRTGMTLWRVIDRGSPGLRRAAAP
jgi:hypothetical protein